MEVLGDQKPVIEYPCSWTYKIIGTNEAKLKSTVNEILSEPFKLTPSKVSKKGKYISLNLKIQVASETHRNEIYAKLSDSDNIKMVM